MMQQNDSGSEHIDISNTTRKRIPSVDYEQIKNAALGKKYELSLVFVGSTRSRRLNRELRGKDKPANILSLPLSETEGEIFIDLGVAKKHAPNFDRSYTNFVAFLFIHGLFHLQGFDHGEQMEKREKRIRKKFDI